MTGEISNHHRNALISIDDNRYRIHESFSGGTYTNAL